MCLQHPGATCQQSAGWPVGEEEVGGGLVLTLLEGRGRRCYIAPTGDEKTGSEVERPVPSHTMTEFESRWVCLPLHPTQGI